MTIDRWIAAISSVGTLIAAFLAFFSIREVRLQRMQQFQPRLTPISGTFYTSTDQKIMWTKPNAKSDGQSGLERNTDYSLPLINVGNGAATDIQIEWIIDIDKWIQHVNILSAQTGAGIGIRKDELFISVLLNGETKASIGNKNSMKQKMEYVLPVSSEKADSRIQIPVPIQVIIQTYYECYFRKIGDDRTYPKPDVGLNMNLDIEYKDTGGRAYRRRTVVDATVIYMKQSRGGVSGIIAYEFKPIRNEPPEGDSIVTKAMMVALKRIASNYMPFYKDFTKIVGP